MMKSTPFGAWAIMLLAVAIRCDAADAQQAVAAKRAVTRLAGEPASQGGPAKAAPEPPTAVPATPPATGTSAQQAGADAANKTQSCVVCHGPAGNSPTGAFPILAGQNSRYIYLQLKDFKEGRRKDPLMSPIAQALSKEDMLALADYFSTQKQKPIAFKADAGKVAAGRAKADETLCAMCHLGGFSGQNEIPRVAGQHPEYVLKQLKDFKARTRTNDAGSMTSVAQTLSEQDIENLAHFISNLN